MDFEGDHLIESFQKGFTDVVQRENLSACLLRAVDAEIEQRCQDLIRSTIAAKSMQLRDLFYLRQLLKRESRIEETNEQESGPEVQVPVNSERRRAYARAYYLRRKNQRSGAEPRSYKTSPEQRAYQRSYYSRKKAERASGAEVSQQPTRLRKAKKT